MGIKKYFCHFTMTLFTTLTFLSMISVSSQVNAQVNTWKQIAGTPQYGSWWYLPAVVYSSKTNEFLQTMGAQDATVNGLYSVQAYTHSIGKWYNSLPNDTLYGDWADSTGVTRNNGGCDYNVFGTYWFVFKSIDGYLRPNLFAPQVPWAYSQYCYNTDDGKIYFYIGNTTFTYDSQTRLWDVLTTNTEPNAGAYEGYLMWGSLCYDQYNKKVFLFGGGAMDNDAGSPGTWTLDPSTKTWQKEVLAVEPPPVANAQLVYDPINKAIVLFGGDHFDEIRNETWVYDCVSKVWAKKNPAIRPAPRAGHAFLYMPKSKKIVLIGGHNHQNAAIPEMWTYDVATNTWSLIKRFADNELFTKYYYPKYTMNGLCAVDQDDNIIALGDSIPQEWSFARCTYQMTCDAKVIDVAGTSTYGVTTDQPSRRGSYYEPDYYTSGVPAPDTATNERFLKDLPLNTWVQVIPPVTPPENRTWGTTIYDSDRDQILKWSGGHASYCGTDVTHYSIANNRYTIGYTAELPLQLDRQNNPIPGPFTFNHRPFMGSHTNKAYAYDVVSHQMIYNSVWHTYIYNPDSADWLKTVHIHNPILNTPWQSCGTGMVSTPRGVCASWDGDIYLFSADSLQWIKLPKTGDIPVYYSNYAGVTYDSKRDRLLLSSGDESSIAVLYEYNFKTGIANQLTPANAAIATGSSHYRESVYIPFLDIILFQIHQPEGNLAYNCTENAWFHIPINNFTNVNSMDYWGTGLLYDTKRDLVWLSDDWSNLYALRLDRNLLNTKKQTKSRVTFSIHPNPATNLLILSGNFPANTKVNITNLLGQTIRVLFTSGNKSEEIDISKLIPGTYFINMPEFSMTPLQFVKN